MESRERIDKPRIRRRIGDSIIPSTPSSLSSPGVGIDDVPKASLKKENSNDGDKDAYSETKDGKDLELEITNQLEEHLTNRRHCKIVSFIEDVDLDEATDHRKNISGGDGEDDDCSSNPDDSNNVVMEEEGRGRGGKNSVSTHRYRVLERRESSMSAMAHASRVRHHVFRKMYKPVRALLPHNRTEETWEGDSDAGGREGVTVEGAQDQRIVSGSLRRLYLEKRRLARGAGESMLDIHTRRQYTLKSSRGQEENPLYFRLLRMFGLRLEWDDTNGTTRLTFCSLSFEQVVIDYLHWCFRSSFMSVLLSAFLGFLALTLLFALAIWILGHKHPKCIGGVDFETDYFTDAYHLSWTTFSTVGYGTIHSAISTEHSVIRKCTGITIIVSLEAFVGVLFASCVVAITFAKVGRTQSFAQVVFSDPIVVRYGSGVMVEHGEDSHVNGHEHNRRNSKNGNHQSRRHTHRGSNISDFGTAEDAFVDETQLLPCPILEFQLVNRLCDVPVGQIMDATIRMVASVNGDQAINTDQNLKAKKKRKKKGSKGRPGSKSMHKFSSFISLGDGTVRTIENKHLFKSFSMPSSLPRSYEEDAAGYLVPQRIFSRLEVETQNHPFIQHTWIVRHILDENSPILVPRVREAIQLCGGRWPKALCELKSVKSAILFDQILVSFNGTSNADGKTVYAHKVYEYGSLVVGYRFVNMLYRSKRRGRALRTDARLINDVTEQAGGGGEPLQDVTLLCHESTNPILRSTISVIDL
ncbi:hypothetical protein ACA910_016179 [Epithemia clementina (nom. ined.)]